MEFISEYDFDSKHIKEEKNKVIDELSKRVPEMHATTISMYRSNLKDRILGAANLYRYYLQVKESIQQGNLQPKYK